VTPRRPLPADVAPDDLDRPFWEGVEQHRFLVHRCRTCSRSYWPASSCVDHGGANMEWTEASGRGQVHTFVVYRQAVDPAWADRVPYVVAVIRLDEGPFFHSDLPGTPVDDVAIGQPVHVEYEDVDGGTIPHFVVDGR
jgi:uncharacterized OB-fold protein